VLFKTALRITASLSVFWVLSQGGGAFAQADVARYNVIYTGRLFGYFRYPGLQSLDDNEGCPADAAEEKPEPVAAFQETLNEAEGTLRGTTVRVAVGDNFAPFLLARQMWSQKERVLVPKEEFDYFPDGSPPFGWVRFNDPRYSSNDATEFKTAYTRIL